MRPLLEELQGPSLHGSHPRLEYSGWAGGVKEQFSAESVGNNEQPLYRVGPRAHRQPGLRCLEGAHDF